MITSCYHTKGELESCVPETSSLGTRNNVIPPEYSTRDKGRNHAMEWELIWELTSLFGWRCMLGVCGCVCVCLFSNN